MNDDVGHIASEEYRMPCPAPAVALPPTACPFPSHDARRQFRVPYLVAGLALFELFLGAIYLASVRYPTVPFFVDTGRLWDLDGEGNLPAWFSSTQLWTVAIVVGAIAWREFDARRLAPWSLVAGSAAFAFLSLDEGAMFHERAATLVDRLVVNREQSTFSRTGVWMFIFGPMLLAAAAAIAWGAWTYLRRHRAVVVLSAIGVVLFLASAAGLETYSNFIDYHSFAYRVQVAAEEVGEMLGVTFMLWAACTLASRMGVRLAPPPPPRG